ncbi:Protein of unknown function [Pyronema omphalodes CBS 100304]|uniref:Uncharacterized protein n=1 Tax=Pyronema omphalodes (strain CBS 100304) TaxID=1076935 RepID=U4KX67_PYROM|nr:Protein of unknown function [Pyronema omphalodes CBS 100304]
MLEGTVVFTEMGMGPFAIIEYGFPWGRFVKADEYTFLIQGKVFTRGCSQSHGDIR